MVRRQKFIAAVLVGLVVTSTGYADMMPAPGLVAIQSQQTPPIRAPAGQPYAEWLDPFAETTTVDLFAFSFSRGSFPTASIDPERNSENRPLPMLSDGQSSITLCLYALASLGLFCAPHWIRRLSLGFNPEWYHDGGPFQIGHSYAATPQSLCFAQVCFIAPDDRTEDSLRQYRLRAIPSLWRKSQCTFIVLSCRGPPSYL